MDEEDDGIRYGLEPEMSWSRWLGLARYTAQHHFGMLRVPADSWRIAYAIGDTPAAAASRIHDRWQAYGSRRLQ